MSKFKYKPGMKKHQVLKEAMRYLDVKDHDHPEDKYEFICHCIHRVVEGDSDFRRDRDQSGLLRIIEDRLYPKGTFNSWLDSQGISYERQSANQGRKLQYTRKMWMQSMYEEFLAKNE